MFSATVNPEHDLQGHAGLRTHGIGTRTQRTRVKLRAFAVRKWVPTSPCPDPAWSRVLLWVLAGTKPRLSCLSDAADVVIACWSVSFGGSWLAPAVPAGALPYNPESDGVPAWCSSSCVDGLESLPGWVGRTRERSR